MLACWIGDVVVVYSLVVSMQVDVDWSMLYYKGLFVGWLEWLLR